MRPANLPAFSTLLLSLAISGAAVGVPAGPAAAVAGDHSRQAAITIRGHGYGHGHGMSQYGAQGAALQGKSYRQIIDFYYPGTSWSRLKGRIRVHITADTTSEVIVSPTAGLTVRDRDTGATYLLPTKARIKRWRLGLVGSTTVIEKLTDEWKRYNPRGESEGALSGVGEFSADEAITLWLPNGSTQRYRGILRAAPPHEGARTLDTVNALSMDSYLQGVVPYEMPASWHREAVRAQAVAARTYATWSRDQNRSGHYQICDTTSCQVYRGVNGEDPRSNAAVLATTREMLTYEGEAAFTQFSSSSGGWTAKGSTPYLRAKKDPYDGWSGNSMHSWSTSVSANSLERRYPRLGDLKEIRVTDRTGDGAWGGRVNRLVLRGSRNNVAMTGDDFRWVAGLRSSWFKVS